MLEHKDLKEVEQTLKTDFVNGLPSEEANSRLEKFGKNALTEKKKRSIILTFLIQFNNPMIYVLIIAAIISFAMLDWPEGIIILVVILLNAFIGTIQEAKAEKSLEALKKLSSPSAVVRRDGRIVEIKAEDLVVGDIVILEEGRVVPADLRLLKSFNLKTDESSLTGESLPIEKNADMVFSDPVGVGDRLNSVYMSTPVVYGRGEGVVVATGMDSEIGKIASMLSNEKESMTPLQKKLAELSKVLGIIAIVLVVIMFVVALARNPYWGGDPALIWGYIGDMFKTAISLAVAAVPEGLPAVVTIVLALGVQRMAKVNSIVRRLPSVETLGAVSVVCSDKTGTLTQNKMTVVKAFVNGKYDDVEKFTASDISLLASGLSLCSNASVDNGVFGDPTEIALVEFANKYGLTKAILEDKSPRIDEIPFDSVRKMMSTMHDVDGRKIIYTKGAIDSILKHSSKICVNGKIAPLTDEIISQIMEQNQNMSDDALRVLALAYHENDKINEDNLIFIGLVGMIDPARPEAKPAVAKFKEAGITTIMITGDHKDTAFAIAKELGIASDKTQCISGDELDKISFEQLQEVVQKTRVFARVSPENKVSIVKAFKANNQIVAMTGDGVNDAPSLKAADIGIAMGITGTDVAKSAADMVLTDDNFASIEKAVEEGRNIYLNIKKTVLFLLSSNFGEVITMLVAVCIGLPLPLIAIHILWVNLITDSLPAIALGVDAKDKDIMRQEPRKQNESLFSHGGIPLTLGYGLLIALLTLGVFLYFPLSAGTGFDIGSINAYFEANPIALEEAQSAAFTTLAISQLFHMLGMTNIDKSIITIFKRKNILLWVSFVVGFALQVAVTEIPGISGENGFFNTYNLTWMEWLSITALCMSPLLVHEIIVLAKWIIKSVKRKQREKNA